MPETAPRGGSYIRDPETGELTLVEETLAEGQEPSILAEPAPAATVVQPDKKTSKAADTSSDANNGGNSQ